MNPNEIRILVVDDEVDIAQGTAHLLDRVGYVTATALNGEEGLRVLHTFRPHMLLLDRDLPGMDGVEVCRQIKADPAFVDVLVILISGTYTRTEEQIGGLQAGADGYLVRPIANRELVARVEPFVRLLRLSQSLRDREREMATLMDNLPGMAYRCRNDQKWTMEFVSDGAEALTGHPAARLVGNHRVAYADLIHPSDREAVWTQVQASLARREPFVLNYRLLTAKGEERWVWEQGQGIFDSGNQLLTLEGFVTDITERKRMEAVQAFLAQADIGAADGQFFNALAGFLAENLQMDFVCIDRLEGDGLNASTLAVLHAGHFEDNVTYALKDTPCGDVVGKQVCCFTADVIRLFPNDQVLKDLHAESYAGVTLFDHLGKPIGLIAVISRKPLANRSLAEAVLKMVAGRAAGELERLQAEEALRESEERFRAIFEESPLGVALIDSLTGHIYEANPRFVQIAGRTRAEMITMDWMSITHPDDLQEDLDYMALLNAGKIPGFNMNKRYYRPDGSLVWIHMTIAPMSVEDRSHPRHMCMIEDITEHKWVEEEREKLQAQLTQSQKMESVGRLAGGWPMILTICSPSSRATRPWSWRNSCQTVPCLRISRKSRSAPNAPPTSHGNCWPSPASKPWPPECST